MIKNIVFMVIGVILLTGCATSNKHVGNSNESLHKVNVESKPKSNIEHFILTIDKSEYIIASDAYKQTIDVFTKELTELLQQNYPNATISDEEESERGIQVYLKIVDFAYVSGAKRFLVGSFGGNARLSVNIQLIDLKSKAILLEDNFAASSSKWSGIFGAMTSRQIKSVSQYILNGINNTSVN